MRSVQIKEKFWKMDTYIYITEKEQYQLIFVIHLMQNEYVLKLNFYKLY